MIQANDRIVTLKLKRSCVVKMMLAAIRYALDEPLDEFGRRVWTELYEELRKQLDDFDKDLRQKAASVTKYNSRKKKLKQAEEDKRVYDFNIQSNTVKDC